MNAPSRQRRASRPRCDRPSLELLERRQPLAVDFADSIAAAPVFAAGGRFAGVVGDGPWGRRDVDLAGFRVAAGGRLTVDVDASSLPGGSTLDSYLRVFDAFGRVVAFNDDSGGSLDSFLSISAPVTGTYYVGVSGFGNWLYNPWWAGSGFAGSTGGYAVTVTVADPFLPPAPIPPAPFPPLPPLPPAPVPVPPAPVPSPPAPPLPSPVFRSTTGWGVVDASAAVSSLLGDSTAFVGVPDLGGNQWGNDLVNAPEVWARGMTGRGIVVAVVDTGVDYDHPDLSRNIWVNPREVPGDGVDNDRNGFVDDVRGWDFVGRDAFPMDVVDTRIINGESGNPGHGTHVAGTIAAVGNGLGSTGVAPDARIMPVRVLDHRGGGTSANIARGIRYAADNGAQVINLSLRSGSSSDIDSAIRHAVGRGSVVVIAAGNSGQSQPGHPARLAATLAGVISVGAVDRGRELADFSHRAGTDPRMRHVVAPGVAVHSTLPNGRYGTLSGTSMAAPHVAGVAALMRAAVPVASPQRIQERITGTARQPAVAFASTAAADRPVTPRAVAFAAAALPEAGVGPDPAKPGRIRFDAVHRVA